VKRRNSRRDEDGLTKREKDKMKTIEDIKTLYEKGYKQVDIVKELGLTKGRVSQIVKEIKKQKV
jgi:DNA-binding transcriptional regulator GbsR (MarR family)